MERYAAQASRVKVGLPDDETTEVGAIVHPEHFEKVMSYVEIGKTEARLVAGGGRPEGFPEGNFVQPTVFADVAPDARIFQEEIFGPVVAITPSTRRRRPCSWPTTPSTAWPPTSGPTTSSAPTTSRRTWRPAWCG